MPACSSFSGQFRDAGLEAAYGRASWPEAARNARLAILIGLGAFVIGLAEKLIQGVEPRYLPLLLASHFLVAACGLYAHLLTRKVASPPSFEPTLVLLAGCLSLAGAVTIYVGAIAWPLYAVAAALTIIYFTVFIPSSTRYASFSVGLLLIGYVGVLPLVGWQSGAVRIVVTEIVIAAIGLMLVRRTAHRARYLYWRRKVADDANHLSLQELEETRFAMSRVEESAAEHVELMEELALTRDDLERQTSFLTGVLDSITQGVCVYDKNSKLAAWNKSYCDLLEMPDDALYVGMPIAEMYRVNAERGEYGSGDPEQLLRERLAEFDEARKGGSDYLERARPNGTVIEIRSSPMPGGGFVDTYTDITERKRSEDAIRKLAEQDALTGLPNRIAFDAFLGQAVQSARDMGDKVALAVLDLDGFKDVNDNFGHPVGDALLRLVAGIIRSKVRGSDLPARLGGDEFAVVFRNVGDVEGVRGALQRIISIVREPFAIEGAEIRIGVSVGLAIYPDDADEVSTLVKEADQALYGAKRSGKGRLRIVS